MKTLADDTSPEAERVLIELYRKASPIRKLEMVESATRTAKALAMAGLKERYRQGANKDNIGNWK